MKPEAKQKLLSLVRVHRWAAIATVQDNAPFASWAAYVFDEETGMFYLHLSQLAHHTRNLLQNPRISLTLGEHDHGADPQELARVSIQGELEVVEKNSVEYEKAKQVYLARLPDAAQLFDFTDFLLFRLEPMDVRYVAGFAQAFNFDRAKFRALFSGEG